MIKVADIKKRFDDVVAVDGISFELKQGETFGLLGPNGAGKSTTINIIIGALKPDEGSVEINDPNNSNQTNKKMLMGNSPQALSIYEELSARENLFFFGKLYRLYGSKLKERVEWAIDFAALDDRQTDRVKTYSGGMKRRLNLACALVHDPPVLLLDEPTVGVDPQSRNKIFEAITKLRDEGKTIIYTTHYMEEASRLCDRVAIIDRGKILALDTVSALIEQYGGQGKISAILESIPDDMTNIPGIIEDSNYRLDTDNPIERLQELIELGLRFREVKIESADLETVFLNLTGRRLRD